MPELPEVEIVRRELSRLDGFTVVRLDPKDRRIVSARRSPVGRQIRAVGRRGKWLRVELDEGFVFAHLGMTGDWSIHDPDEAPLPFERIRLDAERSGVTLSARYTDPRRFGRFIASARDIDAWLALGPDPWLEGIDEERLLAVWKRRKAPIKAVLLDQSILAGVGNILAVEALWNAQLDPRLPARLVNRRDVSELAAGLRTIIARTLEYDESSVAAAALGAAPGEPPFSVYGRAGKPCLRCGAMVRQFVLAGRGTAFCPGCQKRHAPTVQRTS